MCRPKTKTPSISCPPPPAPLTLPRRTVRTSGDFFCAFFGDGQTTSYKKKGTSTGSNFFPFHSLSPSSPLPQPPTPHAQIVYKYRQPAYWYFTSWQDGLIKKKNRANITRPGLCHALNITSCFFSFSVLHANTATTDATT
jgi:hypothetical protein